MYYGTHIYGTFWSSFIFMKYFYKNYHQSPPVWSMLCLAVYVKLLNIEKTIIVDAEIVRDRIHGSPTIQCEITFCTSEILQKMLQIQND